MWKFISKESAKMSENHTKLLLNTLHIQMNTKIQFQWDELFDEKGNV